MLIFYERDKIFEHLGSDSAKLKFSQIFDAEVEFSKDFTRFFCSGIFQTSDGPPVLILPWFLKNKINILKGDLGHSEILFFDFIKEIKYFLESSASLSGEFNSGLAFEIITHSFLKKLENFLLEIITNNFFVDVEDNVTSIKGKWNISRDLMKGTRPIKFNCIFNSVDKNVFELQMIKGACIVLNKKVKSIKNKMVLDVILRSLDGVETIILGKNTLLQYKFTKNAITLHNEWSSIYEFIKQLTTGYVDKDTNAGIAYKLPVDKFFEDIIFYILNRCPNVKVAQRTRTDLLGGSSWVSQDGNYVHEGSYLSNANIYSVPDIFLETTDCFSIVECKYKPLRIYFLNDDSKEPLKSFSRDDRNQLFSFLLSVQPTLKMKNKKIIFNVIFPSVDIESLKSSTLAFPYSKFSLDNFAKNIVHRNFREKENSESILKFHFIGINLASALDAIKNQKLDEFSEKLLNHLTLKDITFANIINPETVLQEKIQRRIALANVIIDEGKNDKTLGRTKLAKLIFLSDSIFNLELGLNYTRAAAGPLDMFAIVDDRIGIESIADKHSYFKTIKSKRFKSDNDKYNYVPGVNLESGLKLSDEVLVSSIDAIRDLIKKIKSLNTEQSEIVATLYGCWNDLLFQGFESNDDQIIDEFLNNWHESKIRFRNKKEVLKNWIDWMRRHNIVPIGDKALTKKIAA